MQRQIITNSFNPAYGRSRHAVLTGEQIILLAVTISVFFVLSYIVMFPYRLAMGDNEVRAESYASGGQNSYLQVVQPLSDKLDRYEAKKYHIYSQVFK